MSRRKNAGDASPRAIVRHRDDLVRAAAAILRAQHRGDPARVVGCPGCDLFGLCAYHDELEQLASPDA